MTAHRCASLAGLVLSFIACFILLVIAPLVGVFCVSGELYTDPSVQKDVAVEERKPSSTSTDSNETCKDDTLKDNTAAGGGKNRKNQKNQTNDMCKGNTLKQKDTAAAGRNWSCNAGDSGIAQRECSAVTLGVQDQNSSSNAKSGIVPPKKEPCPVTQDCDFEFKVMRPTGLYVFLAVNSL